MMIEMMEIEEEKERERVPLEGRKIDKDIKR